MTDYAFDVDHEVALSCDDKTLRGLLHIPTDAQGIVLFVHGSGSSHLSPRNQQVARALQQQKIATLLFDLLTIDEETIDRTTSEYRFNIHFLADRLYLATQFVLNSPSLKALPIGYFGASTGAAAALVVAARLTSQVKAVVSRGGRPDMAGVSLAQVQAPTLLLVGRLDRQVIALNENAMQQLACVKRLDVIDGATHLFEEPGKLEKVSALAVDWFRGHL